MTSGGILVPNADDSQSQGNRGPDQRQTPTSGPAGRDSIADNRQSHINSGGGQRRRRQYEHGQLEEDRDPARRCSAGNCGDRRGDHYISAVFAFLGKVGNAVKTDELNAQTTCADYLKHDSEERAWAVREVGVEVGNRDVGDPLL